ncbi:MAG: ATP-binding protein, partial [Verrucomicrobiota bacterium]
IGTGEGSSEECVGLRKDGSTFPVAIHTRMGTWQGRITQITVLRDLSEAKQAAAVLHAQQTQLEHVQRLALVSEVNAGIIHQISQPLCAMAANIASVTTRLEACKQEHCGVQGCDSLGTIKDIDADIARMRSIVIQLRTLIDPEQPLHKEIDFNHTLATVLPLLRQKAATARVRLAVELGQDLPPVQANAVQMDQVIYNLVNNACEACSDVPPERRLVVLTTRALAGEGIELCVRDAGSGIPPAILPRLFTPFFSTKAAGFGIGLRISQTIVQTHGGSISGFNNANGHGATFRVVLPLHPPNKRQKVMDWDSR